MLVHNLKAHLPHLTPHDLTLSISLLSTPEFFEAEDGQTNLNHCLRRVLTLLTGPQNEVSTSKKNDFIESDVRIILESLDSLLSRKISLAASESEKTRELALKVRERFVN